MSRFDMPVVGPPVEVRFPAIARETLPNGMGVWTVPLPVLPVVTILLVVPRGSADDPADRAGLASVTADLLDEGAGTRDAIELAAAFGRMGTHLELETRADATFFSMTALSRFLEPSLALLADILRQPRLAPADFDRVRELRLSRLRQLRQLASSVADRAYVSAIFGDHPYGHGSLGTTASIDGIALDDVRAFWARQFGPLGATLIVTGATTTGDVMAAASEAFGLWDAKPDPRPDDASWTPAPRPDPRIRLVDRPGAPQSELRIGHVGPPRSTPDFHALITMNAALGGQFTSRINRRLREEKGLTYGARTSFDLRRVAGSFTCETSVQADATAQAVEDVLAELEAIRGTSVLTAAELAQAKASLTRGYVRNFETSAQIARATAQLAVHGLPDDTFDRFVPEVGALTSADVHDVAVRALSPAEATVVVVGDRALVGESLGTLGRAVTPVTVDL
jgi:predicted Zn-dependent peptidase